MSDVGTWEALVTGASQIGPSGIAVAYTLSHMRGWLITRSVHREIVAQRDAIIAAQAEAIAEWQRAYRTESEARLAGARNRSQEEWLELMDTLNAVKAKG